MQNKGAIRFFAILLALVCVYQLSFTFYANKVRKQAKEYANGDTKRETHYIDSIKSEVVYNFLGMAKYTYQDCQQRELNLGLDLKGGMNVILEVSVVDILKGLSYNNQDTTFQKAILLAKEKQKSSNAGFVTLFGEAFNEIDPNAQLAAIFDTRELSDRIDFNSTNEQVLKVLKEETESAIDNAFNIISTRIDKFGVAQPRIQQLETEGRILVELPGVENQDRVRKLLKSTASLEFWETYNVSEIYQRLLDANAKIAEMNEAEKAIKKEQTGTTSEPEKLELSDGLNSEESVKDETQDDDLALLEELGTDSTAVDSTNLDVEQWKKSYPLFSILSPNIDQQGKSSEGSVVGRAHFKDTTKINYYLRLPQIKKIMGRDVRFLWSAYAMKDPSSGKFTDIFELHAIKITGRDGKAKLTGDVITNARPDFDQNSGRAEVSMTMSSEGAKTWGFITKENVGKSIAIVMDNNVYSSPVVQTEIKGGVSQINGSFSFEEAEDLANMLKSGKLPAPAEIIQEAHVGPTLGHESINSGLNSFIIAFLVILAYMIFYYNRRAGFVADFALIANMFFIIGVLASLGAALTLPGIAGIVLTIGMSVDANVLIYERIREEISGGKGLKLAVADGYKQAYSAIIDANVTTLLTGVILYIFGTGPIKGFATTLVIGIITSLFSAIFITRLIFIRMLDKNEDIKFSTKLTQNAFKNTAIDFIGKRKIFYVISGLIIVVGIGSLFVRGLSQGVDFTGGRTFVVRFEEDKQISTIDVQNMLEGPLEHQPEVVIYGKPYQIRVVTRYMIDDNNTEADKIVEDKLFMGLQSLLPEGTTREQFMKDNVVSSQKVGPTIADDIKVQAVWAITFALIIMFLYILFRFRNWQFGLGAIAALMHDAFIIIGLYSLLYGILPFSLEIDQAFIAAILTVVGYSVNDTVVVFDRIREYVGLYRKRERKEILNLALNSTLSRTFSTSLSTFFVLLAIFIFGGEVIRGFTFALLVGVVVGTYSSLFIATPVVYDTIKTAESTRVLVAKKRS